ncbi:hypothetical protein [Thermohalobacter berrensis]|uniref:Na+-translocating membrane potential-generating system MpsC domain-containing protein n=1 Tax=Thermohalobacter berrensis TaxID=99594 RepID=A0A419T9Q8_9FIRM|nr:hypothetical protein [Thermohalobacter berrensis]RKD34203.1 hypothetical protein BET03_07900 [Thermohalobacter berrensis]
MKHEMKRISKILDELITFCFLHGTKKMDLSLEDNEDYFKIHLEIDNIDCNDERVKLLKDLLNYPRQQEMEEYYWELAGECDRDTELTLVGIMTDKAEVEFKGTSLYITLYRYK